MEVREQFQKLRQEMLDKETYKIPETFFAWALQHFPEVNSDQYTATSFAFELFDRISEVEGAERFMGQAVRYANTLGIAPWQNVSALRHQASSVLSEFIEQSLIKNG